ncbi:aromatic ring-hydroxylating dioxygenase subunit alpha [Novosphingobium sp. G106]|uniref:aromatic ring-hydroxylating oxygenase subunit alpha n=1 Tax=Novosphingobium sp. G106 TaxID=2849500 RepID=UPI001C2D710F|nr:aromatic ring-hydroxylating dioxygenase subunit alpha [Novosphingobium sp. G106]MBV1690554.1 aromatic ring-hydroxylating dioxygenase subunit alpha [Novosphingobium sp. G106]
MNEMTSPPAAVTEKPVVIPIECFVSRDYARAESDKLWGKVWQTTCRVEEIPKVGDYATYDIMDESIIVVRTAPDTISAYYNVCQHRGRRLTKGCGHTNQFYCPFHGWSWNIEGRNTFALDREDWGTALTDDNIALKKVRVDTAGGWVWINMDPDAEPLSDFLGPVNEMFAAFELDRMRFAWRQWLHFPCNWKAALGAFNESYHVHASHPQLSRTEQPMNWWCRAEGKHAWHGPTAPRSSGGEKMGGLASARAKVGLDPRVAVAEDLQGLWDTLRATTTETFVKAAERLVDELPEGSTIEEVGHHLLASAKADDAARGVVWPEVAPERLATLGIDWHIFPNAIVLPSLTTALCYRARPHGDDPGSCVFEVCVLERFPEGQEPKTQWVHEPDPTEEKWRLILAQDFGNMEAVQQGMKSRGFVGARPNPIEELTVAHFHRILAEYMGTGGPVPIEPE